MNISSEKNHSRRSIYALGAGLAFVIAAASGAAFVHEKTPASAAVAKAPAAVATPSQAQIKENVGKLPLAFEPNKGQTDARVKYVARAKSYTAFLTADEAVLRMGGKQPTVVEMKLENANAAPKTVAEDLQVGKSNYLIGNDRSKWVTGVPHYGSVRYQDVYPGIDLAYRGTDRNVEYDFVVKAGADASAIRLAFAGQRNLSVDNAGNLVVEAGAGASVNQKPVVYQTVNGQRTSVQGEYVLLSKNEIGFRLGSYDHSRPVVIDPVLMVYSFVGGAGDDQGWGVAASNTGVYLTGQTNSTAFPTTPQNPANGASATPIYQTTKSAGYDAFVTQMSADGTTLIWSTYLGGNGDDIAKGVAVDSNNAVYVAGYTSSSNLPKTIGSAFGGVFDAFVAKLSSNGQSLTYLTYLGGSGVDQALAIALDSTNDVYVGGSTTGGLPTVYAPYSTYGGGNTDGFVAKMDPNGNLVAATYLGGSGSDQVNGIAADSSGNVYVVGNTTSVGTGTTTLFPTTSATKNTASGLTAGKQYAFYAELKFDFSALLAGNVFGGGANLVNGLGDSANAVAVGNSGSTNASNGYIYVGGTAGNGFALNASSGSALTATGTGPGSGATGGFVAAFKQSNGTALYLTFPSNPALINAIAADNDGQVYFAGQSGGNTAVWGRISGPSNGTPAIGGTVMTQSSLHGGGTDVVNGLAINSQREAYLVGSTSSAGPLTAAGSVTGTPQVGYQTSYSSGAVTAGNTNSGGANDVLFAAVQYQDLILTTSPTPSTPPTVTFNANVNGSNPGTQYITISVSNGAACTPTFTALPGGSPFTIQQVGSTSTYTVSLNGNANTANVGTMTQPVTFSSTGCADNSPIVNLVYNVNTSLTANAGGALTFTETQGTGLSGNTDVNVPFSVATTGGNAVPYTVSLTSTTAPSGATFPSSCFLGGTAPNPSAIPPGTANPALPFSSTANVAVSTIYITAYSNCLKNLSTSTLPAGTYTANLQFTGAGISNTPSFPITLTVNAQGAAAGFTLSNTTQIAFNYASGSSNTQQQVDTVTAANGSVTYTATIAAVSSANLAAGATAAPSGAITIVSGASGTLSANGTQDIVIQANPTGLANGVYEANLSVTSNTSSTATTVPIFLTVGNGLTVSPASLSFSAPQGYPSSQLANNGQQTLTLNVFSYNNSSISVPAPTVSGLPSGSASISPTTACTTASCTYTLTVNTQNVVAGTYNGTVTFTPPSTPSGMNTVSVPVTLSVSGQPAPVIGTVNQTTNALVPMSSTGIQLSAVKTSSGGFPASVCTSTTAAGQLNLGTNGGSDTISSLTATSSNAAITLTATTTGNGGTFTGATLNANAPFLPITVCATQSGSANNVPLGTFTGSIKIVDSFNATTTIPVSITVSSALAGEIGIFRSVTAGSGGPAYFVLDVNGNYSFDFGGVDKFRFFGLDGDYPVAGDWTGTGVVRLGVFRRGSWFLDLNNDGTWNTGDGVFSFGLPGDIPVVGDWNGNGISKFGVFRCPTSGVCTFVLDYAGKQAFDPTTAQFLSYGLPGDYPVANNWTGLSGGTDQIGVFRCPAAGKGVCTWFVNSTGTGYYSSADAQYSYGLPGDIPVVGNWNGTGRKRIGVFRGGIWILNISGSNVYDFSDSVTSFGLPGDKPVVGNWTGTLATNP